MKSALLPIIGIALFAFSAAAQSGERTSGAEHAEIFQGPQLFTALKWDYFLYPVPAVDKIYVKITKGHVNISQINITDEFGNDVLQLTDLSASKMEVDISTLPEGIYFMQILPDDKSSVLMKRFFVDN